MDKRIVKVECYSGGRAEERPRRITIDGREHIVARLLAESIEESPSSKLQTRHYKLLTEGGEVLEVALSSDGIWHLISEVSLAKPVHPLCGSSSPVK